MMRVKLILLLIGVSFWSCKTDPITNRGVVTETEMVIVTPVS
jgi:hypothetical protein